MNTKLILSSLICGLCFTVAAQANAKTTQDPQTQKYQQVCKGKKQGDAVSFAYKGVVFNGVNKLFFFSGVWQFTIKQQVTSFQVI